MKELKSYSLRNFLRPRDTSYPLDINILISTRFLSTLNLCPSLSVKNQV